MLGVLDRGELALAVVDVTHRQIVRWLTPPLLGVAWPPDAYLGELVHPQDQAELERVWAGVEGLSVGEGVRTWLRLPGTDWVRVGFETRHYRHRPPPPRRRARGPRLIRLTVGGGRGR